MPTVLCHACAKPTTLPDAWAKPSYECPFCGTEVPFGQQAATSPAPTRPVEVGLTHRHTVGGGFKNALGDSLGRMAGAVVVGVAIFAIGIFAILAGACGGGTSPPVAQPKLNVPQVSGVRNCKAEVTGYEFSWGESAATGKKTQRIHIFWKNTGNVPIRVVKAKIVVFDHEGRTIENVPNYAIYAVFNDQPGIAPGEECKTHQGYFLTEARVPGVRAEVSIAFCDWIGMK